MPHFSHVSSVNGTFEHKFNFSQNFQWGNAGADLKFRQHGNRSLPEAGDLMQIIFKESKTIFRQFRCQFYSGSCSDSSRSTILVTKFLNCFQLLERLRPPLTMGFVLGPYWRHSLRYPLYTHACVA